MDHEKKTKLYDISWFLLNFHDFGWLLLLGAEEASGDVASLSFGVLNGSEDSKNEQNSRPDKTGIILQIGGYFIWKKQIFNNFGHILTL